MKNNDDDLVSVLCMTYNQSAYIVDALNGFAMQQTNFPFVAVIVDDASTDGEQEVIKAYIDEHFIHSEENGFKQWETDGAFWTFARHKENENCHIVAIYLKRNLYREPEKKNALVKEYLNAKYIALCEGDDYWTDPLKLQKQVAFLEGHEEYSLCCSDALVLNQGQMESWKRYTDDCKVSVEDIVIGGGLWLQTVTFVYRNGLLNNYPDCCRKCHVGDYPLIIWAALNGGVYYLHDETGVYRFQSASSWTSAIKNKPIESLMTGWRSEVEMLKGLDEWSSGMYSGAFCRRIRDYYFNEIICRYKRYAGKIENGFPDLSCYLSKVQRIRVWFIRLHIEKLYFRLKKLIILLRRDQ